MAKKTEPIIRMKANGLIARHNRKMAMESHQRARKRRVRQVAAQRA